MAPQPLEAPLHDTQRLRHEKARLRHVFASKRAAFKGPQPKSLGLKNGDYDQNERPFC